MELYLHSSNMPSWRVAQLKPRENFTFYLYLTVMCYDSSPELLNEFWWHLWGRGISAPKAVEFNFFSNRFSLTRALHETRIEVYQFKVGHPIREIVTYHKAQTILKSAQHPLIKTFLFVVNI
jgi:hypothetical protein